MISQAGDAIAVIVCICLLATFPRLIDIAQYSVFITNQDAVATDNSHITFHTVVVLPP